MGIVCEECGYNSDKNQEIFDAWCRLTIDMCRDLKKAYTAIREVAKNITAFHIVLKDEFNITKDYTDVIESLRVDRPPRTKKE
jgi:hypothetical protein